MHVPYRFPRNVRLTPFLYSMEVVLHSILTCRLIIGMREASESDGRTFELSEVLRHSTLEFVHSASGESA